MMDPLHCVMLTLRSLYPAARLGVCAEYARTRAEIGSLLKATGLRAGRSYELAKSAAERVGEAGIVEHVAWVWLIDPILRTLEVLRRAEVGWSLLGTWRDDERARAEPFDAIELELGVLWADVVLPEEPGQMP